MMNDEQIAALRKMQAVLAAIATGQKIFFNLVQVRDELKLIKENGKKDGVTRYSLTERGQLMLNFQI